VGTSQSLKDDKTRQEDSNDNFMFAANFSDIHLSTIQEGDDDDDDDDDYGLLTRHNKKRTHDSNSFDGGSFYGSHDGGGGSTADDEDDDSRSSNFRDGNKRNYKMNMMKTPKMKLSIKRLVPKLPIRKGNSTTDNYNNKSRGGFLMGGGGSGGNHGYGGM
jgi:hypothetical protein